MMRKFANALATLLLIHLNVNVATDFMGGYYDIFGPYPRIPDPEKVKKEIEFAEECRKFYTAPKPTFY